MTAHEEFAYDPKRFRQLTSELNYPMIAINIYNKETDKKKSVINVKSGCKPNACTTSLVLNINIVLSKAPDISVQQGDAPIY